MNLWHLFKEDELYKLQTFLAGGLWCSDLGSIVGFDFAVEGSGTQGVFVSCWHISDGDPTLHAWTVFGGEGHGFAIRTTSEELMRYVASFTNPHLDAKFGTVRYVASKVALIDPAFDVPSIQRDEAEARLVLQLRDRGGSTQQLVEKMRNAACWACEGREFCYPIAQLTFLSRADSEEHYAMILPIDRSTLVNELVVGWKVRPSVRMKVVEELRMAGLDCQVRSLVSQP